MYVLVIVKAYSLQKRDFTAPRKRSNWSSLTADQLTYQVNLVSRYWSLIHTYRCIEYNSCHRFYSRVKLISTVWLNWNAFHLTWFSMILWFQMYFIYFLLVSGRCEQVGSRCSQPTHNSHNTLKCFGDAANERPTNSLPSNNLFVRTRCGQVYALGGGYECPGVKQSRKGIYLNPKWQSPISEQDKPTVTATVLSFLLPPMKVCLSLWACLPSFNSLPFPISFVFSL